MPKRISDILPRTKSQNKTIKFENKEKSSGFFDVEKKKKEENVVKERKTQDLVYRTKYQKILFSKKFLIPVFIFAFVVGVWAYIALPNAKAIVWPKLENLNFKISLLVDKSIKDSNFAGQIIMGQLVQAEKEITQDFPATGKETIESKAIGTIKIYNNYSTGAQVLIATTRFISDSGKTFRLKEKVIVPGATTNNGKIVPSSIDAKVEADKAGEEYNIGASVFSIPGFVGTPKYTGFYAKSFAPMLGGFIGEKPKITQEDFDNAKKWLNEKIIEEITKSLKEKLQEGSVFLDQARENKIELPTISVKVGDNVSSFNGKINGTSRAMTFKELDVNNFVNQYLNNQIEKNPILANENKKAKQDSTKINYSVTKLELDKGKLNLSLDINAKIFSELDLESIKKDLVGMGQKDITTYFENNSAVEKAEIKLWPFWVKKIPKNIEKIKLNMAF